MMSITHSPIKLAPIFAPLTQTPKRKNDDQDGVESGSTHTDLKRVCTEVNSPNDISNATILQAITALTDKIDVMETKIVATVDAKLLEFENSISARVMETEKSFVNRLIQLEEDFHDNLNKHDKKLDNRLTILENARPFIDQENRIDQLERLARANELVISGIPLMDNENLDAVCNDICKAIEFNGSNSIESCFRLHVTRQATRNSSNRPNLPSILIKFWSSGAKSDFFNAYMMKRNLCVTNIGFNTPSRIYINENLTKRNFEIFRLARKMKLERKIFQFHTHNGRISVKLDPESRNIGIDSMDQLYSLIEKSAAQQHQQQRDKFSHQHQPPPQSNQQPIQQANKQTEQQLNHQPDQSCSTNRNNIHPNQLNQQASQPIHRNDQSHHQHDQRSNPQPYNQPKKNRKNH